MEFRILGPLEVSEDGRPLPPARGKQRVLLALLLLRPNQQVPAHDLVDALWGEAPPETARTALHGHVSALRKLLGANRIRTEPAGYVLQVQPGELDADRFEQLLNEAARNHEPSSRARLTRGALELWRDKALADVRDLSLSEGAVARLNGLRLSALEQCVDAELELGLHAKLIRELEQLVSAEPLRERFRSQLMLALYRSGRQADALSVYEHGRHALSMELGIDPGAALQRLHQQVLTQDPALNLATGAASATRQERKVVTVLVIELVPTSSIDPEDLERTVGPLLARARSLAERFGAVVQPLFSNALVAIFGGAQAHEDDPDRAVRAAIALRSELIGEIAFTFRVGVESGPALVTIDAERVEVTGAVLAAASQLQASAPPGEIAVGERAHRSTHQAFDYEPSAGTFHLARGVRRAARATDVSSEEIPFVGRGDELALLERTFDRACEGVGQLVTIAGEPGSGKSRLVRELRRLLSNRGFNRWREGRCLPYGDGVTFWALGEIVKEQAGILESDSPEASVEKLRSAVVAAIDDSADWSWIESALTPLIGVSGASGATPTVEHSFTAWRRFLEAMAGREPLVILIEDIQWADPALVQFIDELVDEVASLPLLVMCTTRLEFFVAHPGWGGGRHYATSMVLPPLDELSARALFEAILGRAPAARLVTRAGGNPLFAQELARMVAVSPQTEEVVPETVQSVIAARLDTLAPEIRETATHAAVLGEVFWPGAVAAIGQIDQQEAEQRLKPLMKGQFVRRSRTSSVTGQAEYAFGHALLRDVAYDAIPLRKRADLHRLAAVWIEGLAGDRVSDHAEFVAHHYGAALELVRAAGKSSEQLESKTCQFLILAGDRAMRLDVGAAERFYRRALELSLADNPRHAGVLVRLADAAQEAGRVREAESLYQEAIEAFGARGDWLMAARALMQLGRVLWRIGDTGRHHEAIDEAIRLLAPHSVGPDIARAWMLKGRGLVHSGQAEESLSWTEKALRVADEVGSPDVKVWSLQYRGVARKHLGDARCLDDMRESLRLGLELGLGIETAICYSNLGETVASDAGPEEGLRVFGEGIDFSERRGLLHNVMWIKSNRTLLYYQLGDWDLALREGAEVLAWDAGQGVTQVSIFVLGTNVQILVSRGLLGEASGPVSQLLQLARAVGDSQAIVQAMPSAALFEQARGNLGAALSLIREVEVATRKLPGWRSHRIAECVRICVAAGDLTLAEALLEGAATNLKGRIGSVLAARAALSEARGDFEQARSLYREANELWTVFGHRPELAFALQGEARCLSALGCERKARATHEAARKLFATFGALPSLTRSARTHPRYRRTTHPK